MPTTEDDHERLTTALGALGELQDRVDRLERNFRSVEQVAETWAERLADVEARKPGGDVMGQILRIADFERRFRDFLRGATEELERQNSRFVAATAVAKTAPGYEAATTTGKVGPVQIMQAGDYDDDSDYEHLEEKPEKQA